MLRITKIILAPIRYAWIVGLLLGFGVFTGFIDIPGASASQNVGCQKDLESDDCQVYHDDVCTTDFEEQSEVPTDFGLNGNGDSSCKGGEAVVEQETHTLGATSERPQTQEQVLGTDSEIIGK